jgi:two-component sensor histidine kinase
LAHSDTFADVHDARALAEAIVDTVREPLLVLASDLRVIAASRSFYRTFATSRQETTGRLLYELGSGQWDIPSLRLLLEKIVPEHSVMEGYEVDHEFPALGRRIMLLNARKVFYEKNPHTTLLLAMEDITERRATEREMQDLLREKDLLLEEMQHRVANSLQIIASILLLKARTVDSEETRLHLRDAHQRVLSVAAVQQHLRPAGPTDLIEIEPYLTKLCKSLADSMIGDTKPIALSVSAEGATVSAKAVVIGLIVTELVINALKHAFVADRTAGRLAVTYEVDGANWRLSIADDGVGRPDVGSDRPKSGLGTSIVKALAQQLEAVVQSSSGPTGTTVSVVHATFPQRQPRAES